MHYIWRTFVLELPTSRAMLATARPSCFICHYGQAWPLTQSAILLFSLFNLLGMLAWKGCMFYVEFEMSMSISLSLLVRLSPSLMNVQDSSQMFIAIGFFFWFRVHAGKLGQVTNFRPTIIVDGAAKHCIDQYMVSFRYCLLGGNTAMAGGLHARLCNAFLVYIYVCTYLYCYRSSVNKGSYKNWLDEEVVGYFKNFSVIPTHRCTKTFFTFFYFSYVF